MKERVNLSSANAFNLGKAKILSSGKELTKRAIFDLFYPQIQSSF